jgi:F-type H+-transporting ATPase subunit epsilon
MHISIYSLKQILFDGDASSVNCTTEGGEITVLDAHKPLIATLKPGTLTIKDAEGKEHFIQSGKGFLEVTAGNSARILIDEAN